MIIDMVDRLVKETMEGEEDMARKGRANQTHLIQSQLEVVEEEGLDLTKEEVAVGYEEMLEESGASEQVIDLNQIGVDEFNQEFKNIQSQKEIDEEDEKLKRKIRMQNMPTLSNKTNKQDNEFEFEKCYPVYRGGKIHKWMTTLTAEKINDLYKANTIYYDFEIQRGFRKNIKGEKKPLVTNRHIDDILKSMQSEKIAGGALTFCYFKEYDEELEYDEDSNTLIFRNKLAIVDGGHRVFSCIKMKRLYKKDATNPNPALFEYPVFFEFLSRQEAMALFSEYANAGKKIGKNKSEALNVFDSAHEMAKDIIKNSELHNKIETVNSSPKENNIMLFSALMAGIRMFKPLTQKDNAKIVEFLSEFWSDLIYLFRDQMGNMEYKQRQELRKQTFLLEPMFINGFFHIAKYLIDNPDNWNEKLKNLKEDPNFFSRDNRLWLSIMREGNKVIHTSKTQSFVVEQMINKVK